MKFIFCLFVALFISVSAYSQTVSFDYDDSGNRTSRNVISLKSNFQSKSKIETDANKTIDDIIGTTKISIFPNPVTLFLNVNIQSESVDFNANVKVIDQSGHVIISQEYSDTNFQLDFSNLSTGIYFMVIELGEEHTKWKIIKE